MKPWLTAAEIAALRLPGLPATKRNINALAASENWSERRGLCRRRAGKGGGFEFHLDLLPPEARAAYVARLARPLDTRSPPANEAEPAATNLRDDAAEARDARLAILAMAERLFAQAKLPRLHADLLCVAEYGRRALALPDWVHAQVPSLTLRSLQRWRAAAKAGRTARLAVDRGAARRGSGVLDRAEDGRVRVFVLAALVRQPHLSADHVRVLILDRFGPTLTVERAGGTSRTVPVPPVRTIQAALAKWKAAEKVRITALTNPDAYKSRYRLAGSNTASTVTRLNELWQIDASPMDALCVDGRHSVYAAIDVYSRRLVLYVSRTPRAEAVGLLLRKAILAWGVPERIKTDNGSDFTARSSERLFAALGIERELSPAFTPEAKAFVERAIGTFQRDLGPLLPGFIGHSVADRKVIEARKAFAQRLGQDDADAFCVELTGPELQAYCDAWASDRYQHRPHAGLGGATPYARATSFKGKRRDIADVRALDLLLAPVAGRDGVRTMGKQGLRIDGSLYHAPQILPETQVFVRLDPNDLGRAYLFAIDGGAYLGEAICPEILGVDPAKATAEAKRARKAFIDSGMEEIRREARRIKPRAFADAVLRQAAEGSATLVPFPRASVPHATPDLDAAAQAYRPAPTAEATFGAETRALLAEIEAELAGSIREQSANVTPLRAVETRQQRFRRAQEIQARMKSGVEVSPTEAFWLGSYVQGSEYDAMHKLFEDFGESALL